MPYDIRKIERSEFNDWRIAVRLAFNDHVHPDDIERLRTQRAEMDRLYGAFDGRQVAGTGGIDSHQLTVPGGAQVPAAGIAYVCTSPTHRRQGIQRSMMAKLEEDARAHEEPVAILWAAQGGLYDRYGYGVATVHESWKISTEHSVFSRQARPSDDVAVRLADADEAHNLLPQIYDERRKHHPGFVNISRSRWKYILFDAERVRRGWSGYFFAIAEREGRPEGYAVYRIKRDGDFDLGTLHVWGLVSETDKAEAALWRFIFDMDLVDTVTAVSRPVDDPTWWRLVDPRRLQRRREDALWLKLLDPERALGERRYRTEDRLVIEVQEGDSVRCLEIEGGPDGAKCVASTKSPDLSMRLADLSSGYLGEAQFGTMSRTGRVQEQTPGAASRADLMFGWNPRPWIPYFF